MSTILNTNGIKLNIPALNPNSKRIFYIITADWNTDITHALRDGALDVFHQAGINNDHVRLVSVPGTVELVNAASLAANGEETAAVIVIGCVIRGDTPHFDYVCQIAAQGVAHLNSLGIAPVIFGVLTVDNLSQAQQRAGGILGNKGSEAAVAAIEMANLHASFWNSPHH